MSTEEISFLKKELQANQAETRTLMHRIMVATEAARRANSDRKRAEFELESSRARVEELSKEVTEKDRSLEAATSTISKLQDENMTLRTQISRMRTELGAIMRSTPRLQAIAHRGNPQTGVQELLGEEGPRKIDKEAFRKEGDSLRQDSSPQNSEKSSRSTAMNSARRKEKNGLGVAHQQVQLANMKNKLTRSINTAEFARSKAPRPKGTLREISEGQSSEPSGFGVFHVQPLNARFAFSQRKKQFGANGENVPILSIRQIAETEPEFINEAVGNDMEERSEYCESQLDGDLE